MILVDVTVPAVGRKYDFELSEFVLVEVIIREMIEIVCQKEHRQFDDDASTLCLYSKDKNRRLYPDRTLRQCGIRSGEALILL